MAETPKLSVEKAMETIRSRDPRASKTERLDDELAALDEETRRLRAQRQRLERHQRKRDPST